jgi:hypothetical protein
MHITKRELKYFFMPVEPPKLVDPARISREKFDTVLYKILSLKLKKMVLDKQ